MSFIQDIGGLLQSLYDAVGSSISLPHSGTKTLKLRLTVSPDKTKVQSVSTSAANKHRSHPCTPDKGTTSNDLGKSPEVTDIQVTLTSGNKTKDSSAAKEVKLTQHLNALSGNPSAERERVKERESRKNNLSSSKSKRLSSQEHRHLVNLVQKNMERNSQRMNKHNKVRWVHQSFWIIIMISNYVQSIHSEMCVLTKTFLLTFVADGTRVMPLAEAWPPSTPVPPSEKTRNVVITTSI